MYSVIIIFLITMPGVFYAAQERLAQAQALFDTYNPTYDRCRPPLRMGASGPEVDESSLIKSSNMGGVIACMMAGFKDVVLTGYKKLPADLLAVLKEYGIGYILIDASHVGKTLKTPELILYTPKGKKKALLLVKVKKTAMWFNSAYMVGFLLGYPEDDIKAFYQRLKFTTVESDKKEAQSWIENNSKDIEQWITDNAAKYDLAFGDFKEGGIF